MFTVHHKIALLQIPVAQRQRFRPTRYLSPVPGPRKTVERQTNVSKLKTVKREESLKFPRRPTADHRLRTSCPISNQLQGQLNTPSSDMLEERSGRIYSEHDVRKVRRCQYA